MFVNLREVYGDNGSVQVITVNTDKINYLRSADAYERTYTLIYFDNSDKVLVEGLRDEILKLIQRQVPMQEATDGLTNGYKYTI